MLMGACRWKYAYSIMQTRVFSFQRKIDDIQLSHVHGMVNSGVIICLLSVNKLYICIKMVSFGGKHVDRSMQS